MPLRRLRCPSNGDCRSADTTRSSSSVLLPILMQIPFIPSLCIPRSDRLRPSISLTHNDVQSYGSVIRDDTSTQKRRTTRFRPFYTESLFSFSLDLQREWRAGMDEDRGPCVLLRLYKDQEMEKTSKRGFCVSKKECKTEEHQSIRNLSAPLLTSLRK